jgi:PIN domain nuclease of toxin-antitoxin system
VIVLDTHVWLWLVTDPTRLSGPAEQAIDAADEIGVSAISAWEIGMLTARGRIALDRPVARWTRAALDADPRIVDVPLTARVAVHAASLGGAGMHGDPADRFIYATARALDAPLVTRDTAIRGHDPANTVW